jgi:hypothetical protein
VIKFNANDGKGGTVFGLGLDFTNLERLRKGEPISVDLAQLGGQGRVIIFAGETIAAMTEQIIDSGMVTADTKIRGLGGKCEGGSCEH